MDINENPAVVVLVGLPASGKTLGRTEAAAREAATAASHHYSTDDIVDRRAKELGVNYDEIWSDYVKEATAEADALVTEAIKGMRGVLWDQTNMSVKKRRKILNRFPDDYRMECICILPPFIAAHQIELERRLASRPGKNIPAFVMANMLKSFELPTLDEGFTRVMYFDIYGNMIDPNKAVELFGKDK